MQQAPGEAVQKVCPRCSTLSYTGDRHCPWCGGGYRRRRWPAVLAGALVSAGLTLAGIAVGAGMAADEVDARLDRRVADVQRDLDRSFGEVQRSVRAELDRRLPAP